MKLIIVALSLVSASAMAKSSTFICAGNSDSGAVGFIYTQSGETGSVKITSIEEDSRVAKVGSEFGKSSKESQCKINDILVHLDGNMYAYSGEVNCSGKELGSFYINEATCYEYGMQ